MVGWNDKSKKAKLKKVKTLQEFLKRRWLKEQNNFEMNEVNININKEIINCTGVWVITHAKWKSSLWCFHKGKSFSWGLNTCRGHQQATVCRKLLSPSSIKIKGIFFPCTSKVRCFFFFVLTQKALKHTQYCFNFKKKPANETGKNMSFAQRTNSWKM